MAFAVCVLLVVFAAIAIYYYYTKGNKKRPGLPVTAMAIQEVESGNGFTSSACVHGAELYNYYDYNEHHMHHHNSPIQESQKSPYNVVVTTDEEHGNTLAG
jgi:hypothetical protein